MAMASTASPSDPSLSPLTRSSSRSIKKALSNRSRSSIPDTNNDIGAHQNLPPLETSTLVKPPRDPSPLHTIRNSSQDGSTASESNRIRKLIPSRAKRKKLQRRAPDSASLLPPGTGPSDSVSSFDATRNNNNLAAPGAGRSSASLPPDDTSLLTDDSEASSPGVHPHSQPSQFNPSSSSISTNSRIEGSSVAAHDRNPLITNKEGAVQTATERSEIMPPLIQSPSLPAPAALSHSSVASVPERATTHDPLLDSHSDRRRNLGRSVRGITSARKLKEVLNVGKSSTSPRSSPERELSHVNTPFTQPTELDHAPANLSTRRKSPIPSPILTSSTPELADRTRALATSSDIPQTASSAESNAPSTTVTPPTPVVDGRRPSRSSPTRSPERFPATSVSSNSSALRTGPGATATTRQSRSGSGSLHQPSRLANAMSAPLTPMMEEVKTPSTKSETRQVSQGSGFFSTWVSAAQNAASTITTTLNTQQGKSRQPEDEAESSQIADDQSMSGLPVHGRSPTESSTTAKQNVPNGDASLNQTKSMVDPKHDSTKKIATTESLKETAIQRDEAAAKVEDMLAKRAVSAAYEKAAPSPPGAPSAPGTEASNGSKLASTTYGGNALGEPQTTPTGSIVDGDGGSVKRNNSVRSRLTDRRRRGASNATGISSSSTVQGLAASSTGNLNGSSRLSFSAAPRVRNRNFHQLFRSVPEDDFLIEDYSCALQKDILLAGRLYVSEGHICFFSNILGWVTTLVISFEEVTHIERETTAMVFPNAIAIQTPHARHLFRSLLSRESTFELMMSIWKQGNTSVFQKPSPGNGGHKLPGHRSSGAGSEEDSEDEGETDDEDDDEDDDGSGNIVEASSFIGSEFSEGGAPTGRTGSTTLLGNATASTLPFPSAGDDRAAAVEKAAATGAAVSADFPGPPSHAPTDCTESTTHYDKLLKDESIAAPLGKIYSLLFGPASGMFVAKFLTEEQKVTELQLDDDKRGLSEQDQCRSYSYIKPLNGAIGPKQTKCVTTENLDVFDLERSVSVTCTTQTPDVPNGNLFSIKTRYCLSWAPGNGTRIQMNCGVEWSGKSWLKGPIEKGATDGQQSYGTELVKTLKAAVSSSHRASTVVPKGLKTGKRKSKKADRQMTASLTSPTTKEVDAHWGLFEPVRRLIAPILDLVRPISSPLALTTIILLLGVLVLRTCGAWSSPYSASRPARLLAYEELWRDEESDLWDWFDERIGLDDLAFRSSSSSYSDQAFVHGDASTRPAKWQHRLRRREDEMVDGRLRKESIAQREMEEAIRVTEARLEVLKRAMRHQKVPDDKLDTEDQPTSMEEDIRVDL